MTSDERRFGVWSCLLSGALAAGCGDSAAPGDGDGAELPEQGAVGADAGADASGSTSSGETMLVRIATGEVRGDVADGAVRFLKIPYAEPPVGELRWKAPVPAVPWDGERHEEEFALGCPQGASQQAPQSEAEDCLYLNVWRPAEAVENAPVMVWIHGGGFRTGSAADNVPLTTTLWYDGRVFAEHHGIVVVTINYRLGSLGFFAHPALADEGSPVGNQGLFDQQLALEWVQDNIEAFGGDPGNVTIFGESAGSAAVCMHLASPGSRGLFHRAVSESGGCASRGTTDRAELNAQLDEWVASVGCDGTDDVLACLRAKPVSEVVDLAMTSRTEGTMSAPNPFNVVVDGEGGFLPEPAGALFDRGEIAQVPYILGSNTEEGQLYLALATGPANEEEYLAELVAAYGEFADRVAEMYPASRFDGSYKRALSRVRGDAGLVCGTHDSARRAAAAGLDVYMYNFNIPWSIARDLLGPTHASEISHVFGLPYMETPENEEVGVAMNAYWARFAATGDPNGADAPAEWPRFAPDANDDDQRLQLDPNYEILDSFRKEECALWREYAASQL